MKRKRTGLAAVAVLFGTQALADNPIPELPSPMLPEVMFRYDVPLPEHLRGSVSRLADNTPVDNPITDAGATLGRVLFFDKRLSENGTTSCSSCHAQENSFTDPTPTSIGFAGEETARHSMTLVNLRYVPGGAMFWDQRAATLESQVLEPIEDDVEMGMPLSALEARLTQTDYYPPLFEAAFGDGRVTRERISKSLAQFLRSIVSFGSRFDAGVKQADGMLTDFANFTAQENRGKALFFGKDSAQRMGLCGGCHMFSNPTVLSGAGQNVGFFHLAEPANNGLSGADKGVGGARGEAAQNGMFKVSSLRNVAMTAPYMHDGRFETLEQVLAHYNDGIAAHPNLAPQLRGAATGVPLKMGFSAADQAAIIAFLGTLTDAGVLSAAKWADPFEQ